VLLIYILGGVGIYFANLNGTSAIKITLKSGTAGYFFKHTIVTNEGYKSHISDLYIAEGHGNISWRNIIAGNEMFAKWDGVNVFYIYFGQNKAYQTTLTYYKNVEEISVVAKSSFIDDDTLIDISATH
jgi:hypothetical protein